MSERKSWDIAPKPKRQPAAPAPARPQAQRRVQDMRPHSRASKAVATVPVTKKNVTIARGRKPRAEAKEPLKKRRTKAKKALLIALGIALALFIALAWYAAWLPMLRIADVRADGPHAAEASALAKEELAGTHAFVLPRNSLFFIPEEDIRERILAAHPDIEAVSFSTDGLTALSLRTLPRAEAFVWCGTAPDLFTGTCYSANAEGLIFGQAPDAATRAQPLRIYAPILGQEGDTPLRARIEYAASIPEALRFTKALQTLGADIVSLSIRGDEADLRTEGGTRITYVLGREQEAAGIAASVFPRLSLNDGSIQYVDLRFPGKAYFKRAGEAAQTEE